METEKKLTPLEVIRQYVADGIPEFEEAYAAAVAERAEMLSVLEALLDIAPLSTHPVVTAIHCDAYAAIRKAKGE